MRHAKLVTYMKMLKILSDGGPLTTKQLMVALNLKAANLSEKMNFLMSLKLIEKNTIGKKRGLFSVTQKGMNVIRFFGAEKMLIPLKD